MGGPAAGDTSWGGEEGDFRDSEGEEYGGAVVGKSFPTDRRRGWRAGVIRLRQLTTTGPESVRPVHGAASRRQRPRD